MIYIDLLLVLVSIQVGVNGKSVYYKEKLVGSNNNKLYYLPSSISTFLFNVDNDDIKYIKPDDNAYAENLSPRHTSFLKDNYSHSESLQSQSGSNNLISDGNVYLLKSKIQGVSDNKCNRNYFDKDSLINVQMDGSDLLALFLPNRVVQRSIKPLYYPTDKSNLKDGYNKNINLTRPTNFQQYFMIPILLSEDLMKNLSTVKDPNDRVPIMALRPNNSIQKSMKFIDKIDDGYDVNVTEKVIGDHYKPNNVLNFDELQNITTRDERMFYKKMTPADELLSETVATEMPMENAVNVNDQTTILTNFKYEVQSDILTEHNNMPIICNQKVVNKQFIDLLTDNLMKALQGLSNSSQNVVPNKYASLNNKSKEMSLEQNTPRTYVSIPRNYAVLDGAPEEEIPNNNITNLSKIYENKLYFNKPLQYESQTTKAPPVEEYIEDDYDGFKNRFKQKYQMENHRDQTEKLEGNDVIKLLKSLHGIAPNMYEKLIEPEKRKNVSDYFLIKKRDISNINMIKNFSPNRAENVAGVKRDSMFNHINAFINKAVGQTHSPQSIIIKLKNNTNYPVNKLVQLSERLPDESYIRPHKSTNIYRIQESKDDYINPLIFEGRQRVTTDGSVYNELQQNRQKGYQAIPYNKVQRMSQGSPNVISGKVYVTGPKNLTPDKIHIINPELLRLINEDIGSRDLHFSLTDDKLIKWVNDDQDPGRQPVMNNTTMANDFIYEQLLALNKTLAILGDKIKKKKFVEEKEIIL